MNRLILLDSGPLGMVTNPKAKGQEDIGGANRTL